MPRREQITIEPMDISAQADDYEAAALEVGIDVGTALAPPVRIIPSTPLTRAPGEQAPPPRYVGEPVQQEQQTRGDQWVLAIALLITSAAVVYGVTKDRRS
jgi:hypothetical protein